MKISRLTNETIATISAVSGFKTTPSMSGVEPAVSHAKSNVSSFTPSTGVVRNTAARNANASTVDTASDDTASANDARFIDAGKSAHTMPAANGSSGMRQIAV